VAPGDDFFRYANGAWLAATEIPPDRSSYGAGAIVDERTLERTVEVIKNAGSGGDSAKVSAYYAAYLDEGSIESAGLKPLAPELARIDAIQDRGALAQALGATLRTDVDVLNNTNLDTENLFGLWIAQDLSDPKRYLPGTHCGDAAPGERGRCAEESRGNLRPRAPHRPGTLEPPGVRRCAQGQQPLEPRGFRAPGPWPRVGRILRKRRAGAPG
jgi:hypothetical protein